MSWLDKLRGKKTDPTHGTDVTAVLQGYDKFEESGGWPDASDNLNNDLLEKLKTEFSGLHQSIESLISGLETDPPQGAPDSELDKQALEAWAEQTVPTLNLAKRIFDLLTEILPAKTAEISAAFAPLGETANMAAQAAQTLIDADALADATDPEPPESTEPDSGASDPNPATGDLAPPPPSNIPQIALTDFLDRLAPSEAKDAWILTLSMIGRRLQSDGKSSITLSDLNDAIDKVDLTEVNGDNLVTYFPGALTKQEAATRAGLKERANILFGRKPEALQSFFQTDGTQDEDSGKEDGNDKREIGRFQKWLVGGIVLVALLLLAVVFAFELWNIQSLLRNFSINEVARGFITLTFVVGAISIFLIVTTVVVFEEKSYPKDVYERAKTILSMILGILGTVIGFYFGTSDSDEGAVEAPSFTLEMLEPVFDPVAANGYELDIGAFALGGEAPYLFTVSLLKPDGTQMENTQSYTFESDTGALSRRIQLSGLEAGAELLVEIIVRDADRVAVAKVSDLEELEPGSDPPE